MGGFSAQVQRGQTSQPAGKGAGTSPSTDRTTMNLGGLSGQPMMGQPNTNGNTDLRPINPNFVAQVDGGTNGNPYPNTIGTINNPSTGQPMGKGAGGGQGGGKGSGGGVVERGGDINLQNPFMGYDEGTGQNPLLNQYKGYQGPGASY